MRWETHTESEEKTAPVQAHGVSVVVPTWNRDDFLYDTVSDLLVQTHRPLEIVIVDQSDSVSREIQGLVHGRSDIVRLHRVPSVGLPAARNYGWSHALHDMVVFVDDDIRCGPELISEHVAALSQPRVGVVAGGVNDPRCPDSSPAHSVGRFDRWRAEPVGGFDAAWEGDVDHARGCNFSTWKSLLTALGGIDETLQVGAALYEETDFCLRAREAGYRVYFNGRARLTHLNASDGGCRVTDVSAYIYGLSHNRAILIQRHLRWYQRPTALFALLRLGLAYSVRYRRPAALRSCFRGWRDGSRNDRGVTK